MVLGFGQSLAADLFAHAAPVRSVLVHRHDRDHVHLSKKSGPRDHSPEPDLYGARRTSGRAAIVVHIVTATAAVKLLTVAWQDHQHGPCQLQYKARHRMQRRR
jgi:hypothetical protein